MAADGSGGLEIPGGGLDNVPLLGGADADRALEEAGRRTGLLCAGCGGPMDQQGWEYLTLRPELQEGTPKIVISKAYVCNRSGCAHVRARIEQTATARRPWQPWHIFGAPEGDAAEVQTGPDSEQETFWNGEPCHAERCTIVVGKVEADHWAHPLIGSEREAVAIKFGDGETFFIDNQGFEIDPEKQALAKSRGHSIDSTMGYPGWGWDKVTKGRGLPHAGHADLPAERIVSTEHDQSV